MNSEIGYAQALDAPKYELMEGLKHSLGKLITLINKNGYLSALYKDFYCEEGLLGNISKNPENTLENISRIEIVRVHFSWAKEGQELQIFKLAASIKDEILVLLQIQIRSNVSILLNLVYGLEM
ncbi:MAG: hypothetical protein LBF15_06960 [Candidatus Peribacteria bacterium]|jgi:hypothetical protein|nr:hypothetical protein [Candidatus Peribacteria bacterium]